MHRPLVLVGAGKMGGAMLEGWLAQGAAPDGVVVVEPSGPARAALGGRDGVTAVADAAGLADDLDPAVVVFAVKPQQMDAAVPAYARFAGPGTTFLSIAAGKTIGYFAERLGREAAIVRAMPNTPAAVGRGITVLCPNALVAADALVRCRSLLEAVGEVLEVADEGQLDAVTALSGGGPAYVFLLIECLAQAGAAAGLPQALAERLALVTVAGSGELAIRSTEPPAKLRENVTSPGGTTLEALRILMAEDGLQPLLTRAIAAATRRSRELAS